MNEELYPKTTSSGSEEIKMAECTEYRIVLFMCLCVFFGASHKRGAFIVAEMVAIRDSCLFAILCVSSITLFV